MEEDGKGVKVDLMDVVAKFYESETYLDVVVNCLLEKCLFVVAKMSNLPFISALKMDELVNDKHGL